MKNLYYKLFIVLTIGFVCLFISFSSVSAADLPTVPPLDGITIPATGVYINSVPPYAGDDPNNRQIVARLVFDLRDVCSAPDYSNPSLRFRVKIVQGAPFMNLGGSLNVYVLGSGLGLNGAFGAPLTAVAGPGGVVIDSNACNLGPLYSAIFNACNFYTDPALVVTLEFPLANNYNGNFDLVLIPFATLHVDLL